ncbi:MAG: BatA domain-containing protein [Akkermansiaceae bacterium]|nr:BatA domain-containing protein [Akkermansiaceae bacterium]
MSFLAPAFLWSFLALIPLAAVYFLKVRPRKKTTPAYFLWEKIFSEKKAASLFNRLRDLLSLILMLLAFAAVVLALARPEFTTDERKDLLLLVDRSASMSARGEGGATRLAQAKEAAREIVTALNGNQRAAVAAVGRELEFRSHLSLSPRELLDAIGGVDESDYPFDARALEALGNDAHWAEDHRILLLSDGAFDGADGLPENVELLKIGAPAENAGIVAADLRRLPDGRLGFYFRVASSFKETVSGDLVLRNAETGERIHKLIPLKIAPGENEAEVFYLEGDAPAGNWTATLEIADALAKDNVAYLSVPPERPVRVKVAAADRYFFETSVLAFQEGSGLLALVEENPEIVIGKGGAPADAALALIFTPEGESPWWKGVGDAADAVAPRVLVEDHPILRHLDIASVAFIGARKIEPPDGALVLVESETGVPLIYRASREGKTAVVVNLDPVASEFYFSAWFPVLVHGAATHLAGRERDLAATYRPGDSAPVPGRREGEASTATLPDGETREVSGAAFGPLEALGFYELKNADGAWPFGATLATAAESLLDNAAVAESAGPVSRGHAPAYWLIVLAILVLAAESLLYHRRKVG